MQRRVSLELTSLDRPAIRSVQPSKLSQLPLGRLPLGPLLLCYPLSPIRPFLVCRRLGCCLLCYPLSPLRSCLLPLLPCDSLLCRYELRSPSALKRCMTCTTNELTWSSLNFSHLLFVKMVMLLTSGPERVWILMFRNVPANLLATAAVEEEEGEEGGGSCTGDGNFFLCGTVGEWCGTMFRCASRKPLKND